MKHLTDLLKNLDYRLHYQGELPVISNLTNDSRLVCDGTLFIAHKGTQADGFDYISQAIGLGASAILCSKLPAYMPENIAFILVDDTAAATAKLAAAFYDYPSEKLILTGITGTNGKTTTATLLYDLFIKLGFKVGLISTVVYRINQKKIISSHTTPDAIKLNALLKEMVEAGCEYCFMEVSSHAIHQKRISGIEFKAGIFTNITHDHLDYHGSFREYLNVKKSFFDSLSNQAIALFNIDDKNGKVMMQNCMSKKISLSFKTISDYHGKILETDPSAMFLKFNGTDFFTRLIGEFNAYNLLSVFAIACEFGVDPQETLQKMSELNHVTGRFDTVLSPNKITIIIDYAHTPDALANVLDTIQRIIKPGQKLITIIGAGGDRDKKKRPLMGRIAVEKSDWVIFTSDNPRSENPETIIYEMRAELNQKELGKTLSISNRKEAIRTALAFAKPYDMVLVAGKGHETYQEINGVRHHFDDKEEVQLIINYQQE